METGDGAGRDKVCGLHSIRVSDTDKKKCWMLLGVYLGNLMIDCRDRILHQEMQLISSFEKSIPDIGHVFGKRNHSGVAFIKRGCGNSIGGHVIIENRSVFLNQRSERGDSRWGRRHD